ncbi:hypothetical protein R5R35_004349 [Gryllus longicercus]|uniref:Cytochrome c oxidase assembly factor 7 homolog n=1 Tax=Gryllus longicercus TaxID=2509291 RepID=A0AAN9Z6E5_9ORTH
MAYDLKDESQVKEYIHNLGIEYRFGCYKEKKPEVCHLLGDFLDAIKKDFSKASIVYKSNCDDYNFGKSCYKYGSYNLLGKAMKEPNLELAYDYMLKACELGDVSGCLSAGMMNINRGSHCRKDRDPKLGMTLLEKCCEGKRAYCCFFLSGMFISGVKEAEIEKDMSKAYKFALRACELGEMQACANVSLMYKRGEGIEKNEELAAKYRKIAEEMQDELLKDKAPLEFQQGTKI